MIFILLTVSASLAIASGVLGVAELVRTQPLQRPTRYMTAAVTALGMSFVALTCAFALLLVDAPHVR